MQTRDLVLPDDLGGLLTIDTSYFTDTEYALVRDGGGIAITPRPLREPRRYGFDALAPDLERDDRPWDAGIVVTTATDTIIGFAATGFEPWNGRLRLWHLYVAAEHRRAGAARTLVEAATRRARALRASHLFAETPSVNAPAVRVYQRLGFQLVGFDASLYRSTAGEGQIAIYLARMT